MHLIKISSIVFFLTIAAGTGFASPVAMTSQYYAQRGRELYEKGKHEAAITEFHKALQSDPSNLEAKQYLEKLGVMPGILSRPESTPVKIAKLTQEVKVYQGKLADLETVNQYLSSDNERLCATMEDKNEALDGMGMRVNMLKEKLSEINSHHKKRLARYKKLNDIQSDQLEFLERMVHRQRELVDQRDLLLDEQEEELKGLSDHLDSVKDVSLEEIYRVEDLRQQEKDRYQGMIADLTRSLREKEWELASLIPPAETVESDLSAPYAELEEKVQLLKKKDSDIAALKEKLVEAREQIGRLEQKTIGAEESQQVDALKSRVETIQGELDQKNISLSAQENDIAILQERLSDAQEQLGIVQAIVEDKEGQILALEAEVKQIRQRCE